MGIFREYRSVILFTKYNHHNTYPLQMKTLASRPDPTSIVAILKQVSLKSMAWVGVYLLGYFNFSIGWMVTPLLLRYTEFYMFSFSFLIIPNILFKVF